MKYLHVNNLNGLMVEYLDRIVLIRVAENEEGNLSFAFIDPFEDVEVLTADEARLLLVRLMTRGDE